MCVAAAAPETSSDKYPRDGLIAAAYSAPDYPTMEKVGAEFGITRERVRQVIERWEKATGKRIVRSASRRKQARLAEIEARAERKPCLEIRLLQWVALNPDTGCWEWVGTTHRVGSKSYPVLRFEGSEEFANRLAYELWCGGLNRSEIVLATCGSACINPCHLRKLSRSEYMRTRAPIPTPREPQTHCKRGHALTDDNVVWNPGWKVSDGVRVRVYTRLCRICDRARHARCGKKPKPPPPALPPLPDDPLERELELSIRRIVRARPGARGEVLERQISLFGTTAEEELGPPTLDDEDYDAYFYRTFAGHPSWFTWRLVISERVAQVCASDPLLQSVRQRGGMRCGVSHHEQRRTELSFEPPSVRALCAWG